MLAMVNAMIVVLRGDGYEVFEDVEAFMILLTTGANKHSCHVW